MNEKLLSFITGKERKKYNQIIQLIEQKNYTALFASDVDDYIINNFGLSNQNYINKILSRIEQEVSVNSEFLIAMNELYYVRANYFNEKAIKSNPKIIEKLIEHNVSSYELISMALDNGYVPTDNFINRYIASFSDVDLMKKLIDIGYKPTYEIMKKNFRLFSSILKDSSIIDKIIDTSKLTPNDIKSSFFYGNAFLQEKIVKERPDLLLNMSYLGNDNFDQFVIESFKHGNVPEEMLKDYHIVSNFLLLSKAIKQRPELIVHCQLLNKEEKEKIDEFALSMGYVPSISDVQRYPYIQNSQKLMEALILRRPEAIKYISPDFVPLSVFCNLARLSLDNGYIPTLSDIENYPKLTDSFDIMKVLIQENPQIINKISESTKNKEELLKIAISNGFNGDLLEQYEGTNIFNELLTTETAIIYSLERDRTFLNENMYNLTSRGYTNYSSNLYNYLIEKGYQTEEIIRLFSSNFDVMKEIISKNSEYVKYLSHHLSRNEIDELGLLAIQGGYVPKNEDDIFRFGSEILKLIVKENPQFLNKVVSYETMGQLAIPTNTWEEICKIALDNGFHPDVTKMGYGYLPIFNNSYYVMKEAIPLKPSLIEYCEVENKDKYEELCRLALSSGYEITRNPKGLKICSNFDIMAKYIEKNPEFLSNVEITDSDEMTKLLDIAISHGLTLNNLSNNELLKLFLFVDESKWNNYLDFDTIALLQKAKNLHTNNDEISKTIIPVFLSEKITSNFTKKQIEILSCYPKLQEKILTIPNSKAQLIYELVDKYKDNLEWIPILEKALDNIHSPEFINLLSSIEDKNLSINEKENLMYLLMTNNHLDISTFEELKNIDHIRDNYIKVLIERNTLGSLKTAYFEKVFGIDLTTAINLVNLYGKSLDSSMIDTLDEKSRSELILLENMKKIINLNNVDILKYYVENVNPDFTIKPDLMVTYEARLKYLFTKEFNKSFSKPLQEDKVVSNIDGEQDLDIYLAAGQNGNKKCRMMITSIGAYTNMEEPDDYYASWNVDKIASHGCCCSYIGEKNLGTAEIKYCCFGFTDYELGSLQLSGPYDLCSMSGEDSYQISALYSSMFLLPDDVLGYTRHTHNETVWERRHITEESNFKKQPSYIVYFVDNFEDRLTDPESMKQWESVKKAASNFFIEVEGIKKSLPIMVVEREKISKSQLEIIQNKLNEFKTTLNSKLIEDIISDYESNYAGNRNFHLNISKKYFPKHEKLSDSVVGEIIEEVRKIKDPSLAIECINELEQAVRNEQEKYNNTQHGLDQSLPSFDIEEALIDINKLKSKFKIKNDSILTMINNSNGNERQFEQSDAPFINNQIVESQLSSSDVIQILNDSKLSAKLVMNENEISEEGVNSRLKIHGQRHVKNVLLYSALIGQSVVQDEHDLDLLMLSAKYHDVGRVTDAYENHAEAGSKIATEKLKEKCSLEDLSIISTIIEFHEVPRNTSNVDEIFMEIAIKNGISEDQMTKVRQLAEVLKDADALDRTRFINKARLNPKYLQYGISKQLIKFASSLQESYALKDLEQFNCNEAINVLLQKYTPQEILRTIRHSTRESIKNEDVKRFINLWAQTNIQNNDELVMSDINKEEGVMHGK